MTRIAFLLLLACGAQSPTPQTISLRMSGDPKEARVTVDDQIVGSLDIVIARGVAMPPGKHRISVESPGYFPYDTIVEAKDAPVKVDVHLTKIPD